MQERQAGQKRLRYECTLGADAICTESHELCLLHKAEWLDRWIFRKMSSVARLLYCLVQKQTQQTCMYHVWYLERTQCGVMEC